MMVDLAIPQLWLATLLTTLVCVYLQAASCSHATGPFEIACQGPQQPVKAASLAAAALPDERHGPAGGHLDGKISKDLQLRARGVCEAHIPELDVALARRRLMPLLFIIDLRLPVRTCTLFSPPMPHWKVQVQAVSQCMALTDPPCIVLGTTTAMQPVEN